MTKPKPSQIEGKKAQYIYIIVPQAVGRKNLWLTLFLAHSDGLWLWSKATQLFLINVDFINRIWINLAKELFSCSFIEHAWTNHKLNNTVYCTYKIIWITCIHTDLNYYATEGKSTVLHTSNNYWIIQSLKVSYSRATGNCPQVKPTD